MFKSAQQIRTDMINRILSLRSDISVLNGEPQIDMMDSAAIETAKLFFVGDYLEKMNSVDGMLAIINDNSYKQALVAAFGASYSSLTLSNVLGVPADLPNDAEAILYYDVNRMAVNFGLARKSAERASGIERFYIDGPAAVTIPLGSKVAVQSANPVFFSASQNIVSVIPSFDAATNSYYVDVPILCDVAGTRGNLSPGTIQTQRPTVNRVLRVNNLLSTNGGKIRESNEDLLNRMLDARTAVGINTRQGYTSWVLSKDGVIDAKVVAAGDSLMVRSPAGAVDIYIQGESLVSLTVQIRVGAPGEEYILPFQPTLAVNSVVGLVPYTEGVGYTVSYDTTGGYAGSARANTKIIFDSVNGPAAAELVSINFTYDGKEKELQDDLDFNAEVNVPGSDVLVKRGTKWFIISEMKVVPLPGYSQSNAESSVLSALSLLMSSYKLGDQLDYSDFLVSAAQATIDGVEAIDRIEGLLLGRDLSFSGSPPLSTASLPALSNEFYTIGQVTFL